MNNIYKYYSIKNKFNQFEKHLFIKAININTYIEIKYNNNFYYYCFLDILKLMHIVPEDLKYYTKSYYNTKYILQNKKYIMYFVKYFNQFYNTTIFSELLSDYIDYVNSLYPQSYIFLYNL